MQIAFTTGNLQDEVVMRMDSVVTVNLLDIPFDNDEYQHLCYTQAVLYIIRNLVPLEVSLMACTYNIYTYLKTTDSCCYFFLERSTKIKSKRESC